MAAEHRFLKFILPARAFNAIRADTKKWLVECPCGHKRDLWDAGGVRYKATGSPKEIARCPACGNRTWHAARKKTEEEKQTLP
jgi:DNA-directed RNA polymerase subunit RPC12/RpoP